ncbi:MAG: signal peptidase II [Nocardioides sp.]|nr:signal peptidase II [Nocardioides sp.]
MPDVPAPSAPDAPASAPADLSDGGRRRLLLAVVALTAYAVDQVTKWLAVEHLTDRVDDVPLVGSLLQLRLVYNPGAAFSTGTGITPVFTVLAIVVALGVLWYARSVRSTGWALALGFLLAGVTGNLTDRLLRDPGAFHGHVVDFLMLPSWPVFNVADICINVAAGLILLQAFRGVRLDGARDTGTPDDAPDAAAETDSDDESPESPAGSEVDGATASDSERGDTSASGRRSDEAAS